jgi:transposase, IS30 family
LEKKYSLRNIASALNRSVSSISDEIKKNSVKGIYDPHKAQYKMNVRRHNASYRGKKIVRHNQLKNFVEQNLLDGQSPEGIAGRIKHHEKNLPHVSKNTIYRFLRSPYGKIVGLKLKTKKRPKGRRKGKKLQDRVFIDKRPQIIEKRIRVGDAEGDFIVSGRGGKGVVLGVVDRKLRVAFLEIIYRVTVDEVHNAFLRINSRFPEIKTLTLDNDILFQMHQTLAQLLDVTIYFCHPYHSWEKGGIENVNKAIRKFIPKGSNLSRYDRSEIQAVEDFLNDRYMKCLWYATPREKLKMHRAKKLTTKKTACGAVEI